MLNSDDLLQTSKILSGHYTRRITNHKNNLSFDAVYNHGYIVMLDVSRKFNSGSIENFIQKDNELLKKIEDEIEPENILNLFNYELDYRYQVKIRKFCEYFFLSLKEELLYIHVNLEKKVDNFIKLMDKSGIDISVNSIILRDELKEINTFVNEKIRYLDIVSENLKNRLNIIKISSFKRKDIIEASIELEENIRQFHSFDLKFDQKFFTYLKKIDSLISSLYNEHRLKLQIDHSEAEKIIDLFNANNTEEFLSIKLRLNDSIFYKKDMKGKVEKMYVLGDGSFLFKTREGYSAPISFQDIHKNVKDILNHNLELVLKNRPHVYKNFIGKIEEDIDHRYYSAALSAANTYMQQSEVLKAIGFDIVKELKNSKSFEELDDLMNKTIDNHKVIQFAHSITSNKYRSLYTEESYTTFKELYNIGVREDTLKQYIGSKIASFKNPSEFNSALDSLLSSLNDFKPESIKTKSTLSGAELIYEGDNKIIIKVDSFEQCKRLGSSSWCIARDEHYFNNYTSGHAEQYILYDFNKDSRDNTSIIGMTKNKDRITHSHLKDDSLVDLNSVNQKYLPVIQRSLEMKSLSAKSSKNKSIISSMD